MKSWIIISADCSPLRELLLSTCTKKIGKTVPTTQQLSRARGESDGDRWMKRSRNGRRASRRKSRANGLVIASGNGVIVRAKAISRASVNTRHRFIVSRFIATGRVLARNVYPGWSRYGQMRSMLSIN